MDFGQMCMHQTDYAKSKYMHALDSTVHRGPTQAKKKDGEARRFLVVINGVDDEELNAGGGGCQPEQKGGQ